MKHSKFIKCVYSSYIYIYLHILAYNSTNEVDKWLQSYIFKFHNFEIKFLILLPIDDRRQA